MTRGPHGWRGMATPLVDKPPDARRGHPHRPEPGGLAGQGRTVGGAVGGEPGGWGAVRPPSRPLHPGPGWQARLPGWQRGVCVYTPPGATPTSNGQTESVTIWLWWRHTADSLGCWGDRPAGTWHHGHPRSGHPLINFSRRRPAPPGAVPVLSNPPRGGAGSGPGTSGVPSWKEWSPHGPRLSLTRHRARPPPEGTAAGCRRWQSALCVGGGRAAPRGRRSALSLLRTQDGALGRPGSRSLSVGEGTSPRSQAMGAKAESQIKQGVSVCADPTDPQAPASSKLPEGSRRLQLLPVLYGEQGPTEAALAGEPVSLGAKRPPQGLLAVWPLPGADPSEPVSDTGLRGTAASGLAAVLPTPPSGPGSGPAGAAHLGVVGGGVLGHGALLLHQEAEPAPLLRQRRLVAVGHVVLQVALLAADGVDVLGGRGRAREPGRDDAPYSPVGSPQACGTTQPPGLCAFAHADPCGRGSRLQQGAQGRCPQGSGSSLGASSQEGGHRLPRSGVWPAPP